MNELHRITEALDRYFPNESDLTINLMRRTTDSRHFQFSIPKADNDLHDLLCQVYEAVIFYTGDHDVMDIHGFGSSDFNIVLEAVERNVKAWEKWKAEQQRRDEKRGLYPIRTRKALDSFLVDEEDAKLFTKEDK